MQPPRLAKTDESHATYGYLPARISASNGAVVPTRSGAPAVPGTSSTAVPVSQVPAASTPAVNSLSAEQLAAFQAAYIKALAEQKELLMQEMQKSQQKPQSQQEKPQHDQQLQNQQLQQKQQQQQRMTGNATQKLHATVHSEQTQPVSEAASATPAAPAGALISVVVAPSVATALAPATEAAEALAGPQEQQGAETLAGAATGADDDEQVDGVVLATSCAHGPLVTHPDMSARSGGMLASVFPSSKESWLYVVVCGEFGVPWALGVNSAGTIYGRLQFKSKMQQWVLLHVEESEWQQIPLEKVLSSMHHVWGEFNPPKSDGRWICFPYLCAEPASTLDLPTQLSSGKYSLTACGDVQQPISTAILPEATIQRDVKAIGARPAQAKPQQPRAPRKRPAKAGISAAPAVASVGGLVPQLKRQRNEPPGASICPPNASTRGACGWGSLAATHGGDSKPPGFEAGGEAAATLNAPVSARAVQDLLLHSLGASRLAALSPAPNGAGGLPLGHALPNQSVIQLIQYLESFGTAANLERQASGGSIGVAESSPTSTGGLPNNASVQSLLGLLRSSSLQHQLAELGGAGAPASEPGAGGPLDGADRKAVLDLKSVDLATLACAASSTSFEDLRANASAHSLAACGGIAGGTGVAVGSSSTATTSRAVSSSEPLSIMPPPQHQPQVWPH